MLESPDMELQNRLEEVLDAAGVEYRRGGSGGGNQLRQPYLRNFINEREWANQSEVEHIHAYGWYIGNYPDLEEQTIVDLCGLLNNA